MSDNSGTFDIRNFAQTMREITFYRTRELNRPDDSNTFFQAQRDVVKLRQKLERAFNSAVQKATRKKTEPPELWMFGLVAYRLIVEDGQSIDDVVKLSGNKLADKASELSLPIEETGEDSAYMFEKKN